jgi:hypothetical protein
MGWLPTNSSEIKALSSGKKLGGHRTYSFKKKLPLPGAYPKAFSPYVMSGSGSTAVSLSRSDIKDDLNRIRDGVEKTFMSHYFDEAGLQHHEPATTPAPAARAPMRTSTTRRLSAPRVARRSLATVIMVPLTLSEERRQLKAAIRASCSVDVQTSWNPESQSLNKIPLRERASLKCGSVDRQVVEGPVARHGIV